MINDVCDACEFIGPLPDGVQQVRDMHRAFHAAGRMWHADVVTPLAEAFRELGRIARESTKNDYTLTPYPEEHPMPDPELIEVGDTVELARKMSTARGLVTRLDYNPHKGIGIHIDGYPPYPLWIGPRHDTWTLTEHIPFMPDESELEDGELYTITTDRGDKHTARWKPIDGIRANHPWLDATDSGLRYRRDFIVRARPARAAVDTVVGILAPGDYPTDRATQAAAIDDLAKLGVDYPEGYLDDVRNGSDES